MLNKIMLGACGKKKVYEGFTFVTSKSLDSQLVFDTDWQVKINGSLTSQRARAVTCNEGDTVSILYTGEAVNFSFAYKNIFKRILSPLPNNTNVTSFDSCFYKCSSLTSIPVNLFANNTNVTDFGSCFSYCSSLTSIPENLFANNTNVTIFDSCFSDCSSLTSIPVNLFANNTNVTNFNFCFDKCSSLTVTVRIPSTVVGSSYRFAYGTKSIGTVYVPRGSTTANTFKTASGVNVNVIEE